MQATATPIEGPPTNPRAAIAATAVLALAVAALPMSGALALALGASLAWWLGPSAPASRAASSLLKLSVVGIGAGVDLSVVAQAGLDGLGSTAVTLTAVIAAAVVLGRHLGVGRELALLIGVGTAICGGSAIAAIAPVLAARSRDVGLALGVVFALNAVALLAFPSIGVLAGLDDAAFGRWCALAIHDTSSVVAAAAERSDAALEVATVTKLARALWIVPVGLAIAWRRGAAQRAPAVPGFLVAFVAAAAATTWLPALAPAGDLAAELGRRGLLVALFLTGLGFSRDALIGAGTRTLALGIVLWGALSGVTLMILA